MSLAGIGLVIAKVFLSDMAELEGVAGIVLPRPGGVLIAIGYAYLAPATGTPGRRLCRLSNQA
jgi:uncharacterized membrane protein